MTSSAIVQKLWNYCNVLRDDGMSYGDYVEQLTYLLFLKMADERIKDPYNRAGVCDLANALKGTARAFRPRGWRRGVTRVGLFHLSHKELRIGDSLV
jgi:hypothetical protein